MNCISCNHSHNENYCPKCGERNGVEKITFISTLQSVFITFSDMDKGFLFNIKNLILDPKKITEDYIKGQRKKIYNPISFLIIAVTIFLFVNSLLKTNSPPPVKEVNMFSNTLSYKISYGGGIFIKKYFKFFWVFTILPFAFITKLFFKRYNFLEHIAIGSFIIAQATLVGTISYVFLKFPIIYDPFVYMTLFWLTYRTFKNKKNKAETFGLTFTTILLFFFLVFASIVALGYIKFLFE